MNRDFEHTLEYVGSCGKYQKTLLFLVLTPAVIITSINVSIVLRGFETLTEFLCHAHYNTIQVGLLYFENFVPEHWCHVPGRDPDTYAKENWRSLTIPK